MSAPLAVMLDGQAGIRLPARDIALDHLQNYRRFHVKGKTYSSWMAFSASIEGYGALNVRLHFDDKETSGAASWIRVEPGELVVLLP